MFISVFNQIDRGGEMNNGQCHPWADSSGDDCAWIVWIGWGVTMRPVPGELSTHSVSVSALVAMVRASSATLIRPPCCHSVSSWWIISLDWLSLRGKQGSQHSNAPSAPPSTYHSLWSSLDVKSRVLFEWLRHCFLDAIASLELGYESNSVIDIKPFFRP